MQRWATWLLYAVLVDLTDAVAEALEQPMAQVSLEMVYRQQFPVSFCRLLNRNAIFLNATLIIHKKLLTNQSQIKRPGTAALSRRGISIRASY